MAVDISSLAEYQNIISVTMTENIVDVTQVKEFSKDILMTMIKNILHYFRHFVFRLFGTIVRFVTINLYAGTWKMYSSQSRIKEGNNLTLPKSATGFRQRVSNYLRKTISLTITPQKKERLAFFRKDSARDCVGIN